MSTPPKKEVDFRIHLFLFAHHFPSALPFQPFDHLKSECWITKTGQNVSCLITSKKQQSQLKGLLFIIAFGKFIVISMGHKQYLHPIRQKSLQAYAV